MTVARQIIVLPSTAHGVRGLVLNGQVLPFARRAEAAAKPAWTVKAKAGSSDAGEVWIYGDIGQDWFGEGNTAMGFADELKALGAIKTLDVYINSGGGSVFEGVAIYNVLLRHRAQKTVHIDGIAASIASIIAMAGDEIVMARNSLMMIHKPSGAAWGMSDDLRQMADVLDKIEETLVGTYVDRSGQSAADVAQMLAAETWMNADEALALGFIDTISEPIAAAAFAGLDVSAYLRPPEVLKAAVAAAATPAPSADPENPAPERGEATPHPALVRAESRLRGRGLQAD